MTDRRDPPRHAPHDCPVCSDDLMITQLTCPSCETALSGVFESCQFCRLDGHERELLQVFLASRGNLKELQRHLGVSYPTARARFAELLARLGIETDDEADDLEKQRLEILDALARGEIDADEAERQLGELE